MIVRSNVRVRQLKSQPRQPRKCQMCSLITNIKPYELTQMSFVGDEDNVLSVCRKCAYKETYGTKGMVKAMREKTIEK